MRFWLCDLEDITSAGDATDAIRNWLMAYCAERRANYVIEKVEIMREADGWYAVMPSPPKPVG